MPAPPIRKAERWLVLGTSEVGKSFWCKRFVDGLPADATVIVWDPENEWAGPLQDAGIKRATCFPGVGSLANWVCAHNPNLRGMRIVVQGGQEAQFEELAEIVYRAGDVWFIVDEAHDWCESKTIPKVLKRLVRRCRHRRTSFLFVSQRATDLAPVIRNVKSQLVLFQLPDSASRDWVRNEVCEGMAEPLRKLPPRVCLRWSGGDTWEQSSAKRQSSRSSQPTARTSSTTGSSRAAGSSPSSPTSTPTSFSRPSSPSR